MTQRLNCILLIDDNKDDNFFHERVIRKGNYADRIVTKQSAEDALAFLKNRDASSELRPDLIFLDINMPGMNGWEFLEEYNRLPPDSQGKMIVMMLTTSDNADDREKAKRFGILSGFKTKPLTESMLQEILKDHF